MASIHWFEAIGKFIDAMLNWYLGLVWYWQIILMLLGVIFCILIWYSIQANRNG